MVKLCVFSVFCSIRFYIIRWSWISWLLLFETLTYRNSWCHIISSSVQSLLFLYHLFPLLTIARSAGELPFSPTEPLTALFRSVLCPDRDWSIWTASMSSLALRLPVGFDCWQEIRRQGKSKVEVFIPPWMCYSFLSGPRLIIREDVFSFVWIFFKNMW